MDERRPLVIGRLLDEFPDMVLVVDAEGLIVEVHGNPGTTLGWTADQLMGTNALDLFAKQANRAVHAASLADVMAGPGLYGPITVSAYANSGEIREIELRCANCLADPEIAGVIAVARDITGRGDAIEAARRRDAWSQALLNQSSDLTLVVDRNGFVSFAGGAAMHLLGRTIDSLSGSRLADLLADGETRRLGGDLMAALRSRADPNSEVSRGGFIGADRLSVLVRHTDGADRTLNLLVTRLSAPIEDSALVVSATDMTDERLAEDMLAETAHLLESVARGAPLTRTLSEVAALVEDRLPGARCVAGVRDESGRLRHHGAAVPQEVLSALDLFGPSSRPVGATATINVADLVGAAPSSAPRFAELGIGSVWVNAVVGARADLLVGSLVVLHPAHRDPTLGELGLLERYGNVVAIAVERAELSRRLEFRANYDELTGLPNRHELLARIADRFRRRPDEPITLLFADLDRFKLINDSLGHAAGDALLREVGDRFTQALRLGDTVGRLGGDEFVVLCEDTRTEDEARTLADRLRAAIEQPFLVSESVVVVTASIGITVSRSGADPESLLSDADLAMYAAKQQGRNRSALFHDALRVSAQERLGLEGALRYAIVNDELVTWYQPQVSLADGSVQGVEALVRWARPGHGIIEPSAFIPVAEDSGLIVPLGRRVLEAALADARRWHADGHDLVVTVNLSARELADPDLVGAVGEALRRHGVAPSRLCLEVTESDLVADADASAAALLRLKSLGVLLAIDDFGTGYATLDYVRRFAMADVLKIDRSFIEGLDEEGSKDRAIVSAVIVLGQALGFRVVAEGVESEAQLDVLRELRCDAAQGWLFARPLPAGRLADTLRMLSSLSRHEAAGPAKSGRASDGPTAG